MKLRHVAAVLAAVMGLAAVGSALAEELAVGITRSMDKFEGTLDGQPIVIMRNQDQSNTVTPAFSKTSRRCPPFCIQPASLGDGVETIGELEVIDYVRRMTEGDKSVLLIDSRTPDWVARGTIPGAVNIPWTKLNVGRGADPLTITEIMTSQFGATEMQGLWDFSEAKTLVFFCNGMWCGQSPQNIKTLKRLGYPSNRIKWYRGGMQDWEILGLSTVKP
jgi:rhodanese-related sulfurtransferase